MAQIRSISENAQYHGVVLTVRADAGKNVFVAGTFNNWDPTAAQLKYTPDNGGLYYICLTLPKGRYEYKFVINGTWCTDPENPNTVSNGQGTCNSVLEVGSASLKD